MELITPVLALAGVIVGSTITHFFNIRRERETRRASSLAAQINLKRDRLEELYETLALWDVQMASYSITWMMCMQGKLSYNDALDISTKNVRGDVNFHRIEMLIDVYSPDDRKFYDEIIEKRTSANLINSKFRSYYENAEQGSVFPDWPKYVEAHGELEGSFGVLKQQVINHLRGLGAAQVDQ